MCVFHNETDAPYEFHCETKTELEAFRNKAPFQPPNVANSFQETAERVRPSESGIYLLIALDLRVTREISGREAYAATLQPGRPEVAFQTQLRVSVFYFVSARI
jgi:hypothetical protein